MTCTDAGWNLRKFVSKYRFCVPPGFVVVSGGGWREVCWGSTNEILWTFLGKGIVVGSFKC